MESRASFSAFLLVAVACGSPAPTTGVGAVSAPASAGNSSAPTQVAPVGAVGVAAARPAGSGSGSAAEAQTPGAPLPPPRPFAATASEATALIDAAVDARASALAPCVNAARAHRKNPHERIQLEIGLDQEGHLMGVKAPKGTPSDPELFACVQSALIGANFPTSHAGIITVTKTFEDQVVYR